MKAFIPKLVISLLALYILFELTIGSRIDYFMKIFSDSQTRLEVKEKIKSEIKKGLEKENYFTEEERVLFTNFIKKIRKELDLDVNK
jgi:ATP-dependent Lon protease